MKWLLKTSWRMLKKNNEAMQLGGDVMITDLPCKHWLNELLHPTSKSEMAHVGESERLCPVSRFWIWYCYHLDKRKRICFWLKSCLSAIFTESRPRSLWSYLRVKHLQLWPFFGDGFLLGSCGRPKAHTPLVRNTGSIAGGGRSSGGCGDGCSGGRKGAGF